MNIVKALSELKLTGWTWRGNPEVNRPLPYPPQTQQEADLFVINSIEWNGAAPELNWETLQAAADSAAAKESILVAGFDTGLGYNLATGDGDQLAFSKLASGLMLLGVPDEYPLEIRDKNGVDHAITFLQFKTLMSGYIPHCYLLWKNQ